MTAAFNLFSTNIRFADVIDISVIAVFLYFAFTWLRRRASRSLVIGIALVVALYSMAHMLDMYLTSILFQAGLTAALMALVLIFQEDIRMAVEKLSSWHALSRAQQLSASNSSIECLIETVSKLAQNRIGALIVIKGRDSLERHLNGGISIEGRISYPLIYSIFHPETPSHDGALIIEGERIDKFGVRLPLSHNVAAVGSAGTRHSAGLGLSERSDAFVIIVSEERGTIGVADQGQISTVTPDRLRTRLQEFYDQINPKIAATDRWRFFKANIGLKAVSLITAVSLWVILAYRVETVNRTLTIPVEYRNVPSGLIIEEPQASEVQITISGPERSFNFDPSSIVLSLDVSKIRSGTQTLALSEEALNTPSGVHVNQIKPRTLTINAQKLVTLDVPVRVITSGALGEKLKLVDIKVQPSSIKVQVPQRYKNSVTEIITEPLNLSTLRQSTTARLKLIPSRYVRVIDDGQSVIKASIDITENK